MFAGNGAQWPGMGRDAYQASAAFRDAVGRGRRGACARRSAGRSASCLERGADAEELAHADIAQPLLFAVQVGIVTVLRGLGIEAAGHIGHSVGEIAAAWAAGALSLADAARVVVARSRQQERTRGRGRMAALALAAEAARALLAEIGSPLEIAAINATAIGDASPARSDAIERLGAEARRRGLAFRALDLDFAFHSAAMDPIRDDLLADLAGLASGTPETRAGLDRHRRTGGGRRSSTRHIGGATSAARSASPRAWRRLVGDGSASSSRSARTRCCRPICTTRCAPPEARAACSARWPASRAAGTRFRQSPPAFMSRDYDIIGPQRFDGPAAPGGLPLYPWNRERFWFERTVEGSNSIDPPFDHPLLGFRQAGRGAVLGQSSRSGDAAVARRSRGRGGSGAAGGRDRGDGAGRGAAARPDAAAIESVDVELRRPLPFEQGADPRNPQHRGLRRRGLGTDEPAAFRR